MSSQEWGIEAHWSEPLRIECRLTESCPDLAESPRLEAYRQAVALCDEGEWEQGLSAYEALLGRLHSDDFVLAQLVCWGRSSALQQLERYQEAWEGLATLFAPGRLWQTSLSLFLNWLQTSVGVAAATGQSELTAMLLTLWLSLPTELELGERFGELLSEAFEALSAEGLEEAVDWLDDARLEWESEGEVLLVVRQLMVDGLVELLEFEGAIEESLEVVFWAERAGYEELAEEWSQQVEQLREQVDDPYNLARRDDREGLELLGKLNLLGPSGRNALMGAAVTGNLELARWLMERRADPNLFSSDGWTPMLLAADHDQADMVELLVQSRGDLGATNDYDQTCLHVAAWQDYQETARRVVDLGVDVDHCDSSGNTALHLAASEPVPDMIEFLATVLAVDVRNDCTESTPLMLAAECGLVENLELLLRLGADPQARDRNGDRALEYARTHEQEEAVAFLRRVTG